MSAVPQSSLRHNCPIETLTAGDRGLIAAHVSVVTLKQNTGIDQAGDDVEHVSVPKASRALFER
jgi:hypothetical protein